MKRILITFFIMLIMIVSQSSEAGADTLRTQTIPLQQGWNAVYLEVEPEDNASDAMFEGTPVTMAATYFHLYSVMKVPTDPGETPFEKEGWGVWYSPGEPAAFAKNLYYIQAGRAYLIRSESDFQWTVTGAVKFRPVRWQSNSYNFVGFTVDAQSPPTFEQFFRGSDAHANHRIYRLIGGEWKKAAKPVEEFVEAGTAYWIYCNGGSDYTGPLEVEIPYGDSIDFGNVTAAMAVRFTNRSPDPLAVTVTNLNGQAGLPLSYEVRDLSKGETTLHRLTGSYAAGTLEAGGVMKLYLDVHRELFSAPEASTVLRISDDVGGYYDVPVTAE